jgi:toxin ParE1/3/4
MTRRIVRPRTVEADLAGLADYIGRTNVAAGRRFLAAAEKEMLRLAAMPGLGSIWESDDPRLAGIRVSRIRRFKNYLIFYRALNNGIEVVRVLHGSRDIERFLSSE